MTGPEKSMTAREEKKRFRKRNGAIRHHVILDIDEYI